MMMEKLKELTLIYLVLLIQLKNDFCTNLRNNHRVTSNKINHVDPDNKLPDHITSYKQETNDLVKEVKILLTKKLTKDLINDLLRSTLTMMICKIIEQSKQFIDTLLLFVLKFYHENLIVGQLNLGNILLHQIIVLLQV